MSMAFSYDEPRRSTVIDYWFVTRRRRSRAVPKNGMSRWWPITVTRVTVRWPLTFARPMIYSHAHTVGNNAARLAWCRNRSLVFFEHFEKYIKTRTNVLMIFLFNIFCHESWDLNAKNVTFCFSISSSVHCLRMLLWRQLAAITFGNIVSAAGPRSFR